MRNCGFSHSLGKVTLVWMELCFQSFLGQFSGQSPVDFVFPFVHITSAPLLVSPVHPSHRAAVNSPSHINPNLSPSYQVSHPAGKGAFVLLNEVDPISPKQMLILKQGAMVQTKTLSLTPALQLVVDTQCSPLPLTSGT